jgi:hypothetical protein
MEGEGANQQGKEIGENGLHTVTTCKLFHVL